MAGRPVNLRRAIELAAQISDALAEGHSRGLVHGDLRPDNIVITPKGSPKILNFGLTGWTTSGQARAAASSAEGLGADPYGVAGYLSPEQALGGTIDERSDVFSFGVLLQEMLTGRNPFTGSAPAATVMNVIRLTPPPPSSATRRCQPSSMPSSPGRSPSPSRPARQAPSRCRPICAGSLPRSTPRERDFELPQRPAAAGEKAGLGWLVGVVLVAVLIAVWWYFSGSE